MSAVNINEAGERERKDLPIDYQVNICLLYGLKHNDVTQKHF